MNLVERAKNITLSPKTEWPVIAEESTNTADLFKNYVAPLAAIPAIAGFVGMSLIGFSVAMLGTIRLPIGVGITAMVMNFVFALAGVYLISLIIDALAPQFGAQKNSMQALKLAAYSFTPAWLAGILSLLPSLSMLSLLAGLYSIYVLYLGVPVLMKAPEEKAGAYTAASVVCSIVIMVVFGLVIGAITGSSMHGISGLHGAHNSSEVSGALGDLEKMGKKMEEVNKKMEAAKQSGDPQAEMQAATAALGTVLGAGGTAEVVDKDKLKALLPETIANLKRTSIEGEKSAMGEFKISKADARYSDENGHQIHVTITDTGGSKMFASMFAWGMMEQDKETDSGYEKMGKVNGRPTMERFQKNGPSGEYSLLVGGRFLVETKGDNVDMTTIKTASAAVGYDKLEGMKNEGVKQ
ncbi:Yip1 family protein [Undibacterium sp. TS12]|uniref:Yip1 family protein n=1 Tax=Undibacterium sp. TS12 TaxID=2908202 RepID=UPI001F4D0D02|nr:Yip1 family protein [Undibacterium sp. TS12]MCH8620233.1 YIP1 family protein [Undibacterium sp. TS12]